MSNEKADLSIHVRRMKFMQRCQSEETNQQLQESIGRVISAEQWELDLPQLKPKDNTYDVIESYCDINNLRYGRMSFQGFNKNTEKMMAVWNGEVEEEKDQEEDKDSIGSISDEEMAERFTTLVGTVAKKYQKKKKRPPPDSAASNNGEGSSVKKRKTQFQGFMKPEPD